MSGDGLDRVEEILLECLERPTDEREAFLVRACEGDERLRAEVASLLVAHAAAVSFLESPPRVDTGIGSSAATEVDATEVLGSESVRPGSRATRRCPRCGRRFRADQRVCPDDGEPLAQDPESMVGAVLDGLYRIDALVGSGGMGVVYRARHLMLDDDVAVKVLPRRWSDDPVWLDRFKREGKAARRFRHPNAVSVYDLRVGSDGLAFLVLEFVDGTTVRDELQRRGKFTPAEALVVLEAVAGALDAAHDAGVLHRDLKPGNVMIGRGGVVKVLDLGIAKILDEDDTGADLTGHGATPGTPLYMSPEQWGETARDGRVGLDRRADVYSLGVMAYELVSGTTAFAGRGVATLRHEHLHVEPIAAHERVEGVPERFGRAIARAMAKDRSDRFDRAGEFVAELRNGLAPYVPTARTVEAGPAGPEASTQSVEPTTLPDALDATTQCATPNNLPVALTTFVGRERELDDLVGRLHGARMVTILGVGGVGKTRLALELASRTMAEFPGGVWFVELAAVGRPELVLATVGGTFGAGASDRSPADSIRDQIGSMPALLILDNCEHVVGVCAEVCATLLRTCASLRVVATSREPLRVAGEALWSVPSMALPGLEAGASGDAESSSDAIRLFCDRARLARADFALAPSDVAAVAELCRRLDGIPLAIELAAARTRALTVQEVLGKLDDRFSLLSSGNRSAVPRQQTLRATFDWSFGLLSQDEQRLLARLSVFSSGFTLDAVEGISGETPPEAHSGLDVLTLLVDRSLVAAEQIGGRTRFRLLETVREYAREKLRISGYEATYRSRHALWYFDKVNRIASERAEHYSVELVTRLEQDYDNVRATLQWARDTGRGDISISMCTALGWFWELTGRSREGLTWTSEALEHADSCPPVASAEAYYRAGVLASRTGDLVLAQSLLEASLRLRAGHPPTRTHPHMLYVLGCLCVEHGELDKAKEHFDASLAVARSAKGGRGAADALSGLAGVACERNLFEEALVHLRECLDLRRSEGDVANVAIELTNLGRIACRQGDFALAAEYLDESLDVARKQNVLLPLSNAFVVYAELANSMRDYGRAKEQARQALTLFRDVADCRGLATALAETAVAEYGLGNAARALRIAAGSETYRHSLGIVLGDYDSSRFNFVVAVSSESLDPREFARLRAEGLAMGIDALVAYALHAEC